MYFIRYHRDGRISITLFSFNLEKCIKGYEITAINGRDITQWKDENLLFCPFPLKTQCDHILFENLFNETLSWYKDMPLTATIEKAGIKHDVQLSFTEEKITKESMDKAEKAKYESFKCSTQKNRYKDFSISYEGNRLCSFTSQNNPGTVVIRLASFKYKYPPAPKEAIQSMEQEVQKFLPWWQNHSRKFKTLILDLIGNTGGNGIPTEFYKLFLKKKFQEYIRVRKNAELENPKIRETIYWGMPCFEAWYQDMIRTGIFTKTAYGDFLPVQYSWCLNGPGSKDLGDFEPYKHDFVGNIKILLNSNCVSACDGAVTTLKEDMGDKVTFYGQPNAADQTWSRLPIAVYLNGKNLKIRAYTNEDDKNLIKPLFSMPVAVTRTTRKDGTHLQGEPVKVDGFVPLTLENSDIWDQEVFKRAMTKEYKPMTSLLTAWSSEKQLEKPYNAPYIARYRNGIKELSFIAVEHVYGKEKLQTPTFRTIREEFERLKPQMVIIEGKERIYGVSPKEFNEQFIERAKNDFEPGGEASYSAYLAIKNDVLFTGGEPSQKELLEYLQKEGYDKKDHFYLMALRLLKAHGDKYKNIGYAGIIKNYFLRDRKIYGLSDKEELSEEYLAKWYMEKNRKKFKRDTFDMMETAPVTGTETLFTQKLSAKESFFRNSYLSHVISEMINEYDKVMIIYGSGHFIELEAVLNDMLGLPYEYYKLKI